ncbi:hypothetical protein LNT44_28185, partial [Klebsiella pneumoniae]|nr:hypothetical protein [Klebsiella pneumoniae]
GPDPRNFNQRVSLGRNDLLIRTFPNIRVEGTFCFFRGGSAGVVLSPYPLPWHTIHIKVTDVSEDI